MSRTYKATGINLKAMPMGESDRLLTILTPDHGLIRAVAPGSRKHQSRLGGRSDLFVINDWLVVKGKQLDKVIQAETVRTFPGLSRHLSRLTASQYLAEITLHMALSECSQADLFHLLVEHLERLETSPVGSLLAALSHGVYHLLAVAGVAPEVHRCCVSQAQIIPDLLDPNWTVGFSGEAGGLVQWGEAQTLSDRAPARRTPTALTAIDVALLQQLSKPELIATVPVVPSEVGLSSLTNQEFWSRIERLLRQYAQDYFERPIRSAALIDVCFATV
ncbi:MAG: DNA repair protein RecO [Leptolyngbyaceae cyanobacterium SM2_5_2]|nr:DNA repair protein RecO [Leptolyngbyaceae cyanobacterium SM2_5_2]